MIFLEPQIYLSPYHYLLKRIKCDFECFFLLFFVFFKNENNDNHRKKKKKKQNKRILKLRSVISRFHRFIRRSSVEMKV